MTLAQLKQQPRWCVWRLEPGVNGRLTKVPYNATTGKKAMSNNPDTWTNYSTARDTFSHGGYNGVGLFFSGVVCGIDIDGSHENGGDHNPLEAEVLDLFAGTYAERSPSGTGVHILFLADGNEIPHTDTRKLDPRYYQKNPSNGLEFYAGGLTNRFFTFTGNRITSGDDVTFQTDHVITFLDKYMLRPTKDTTPHTCVQDHDGGISIHERLALARSAKNGPAFSALYDHGDVSAYHNDDSAADAALCAILAFWLNGDPLLIDEAFRESALYRPKWDEQRGDLTYGELTITRVLATATDFYHEPTRPFSFRPANAADLTDAGNAERFSAMYRDRLRWCDALGWIVWDGQVWQQDDHAAGALALDFSNGQLLEALAAMQDAQTTDENGNVTIDAGSKAYLAHARRTRSANGIRNMMALAKARLAIPANKLDTDAFTINTAAGLIDLHTGVCTAHDPTAFCTKISPFEPSAAGADLWDQFLDLITCDDHDLKSYLQQVAGMTIIGKVHDEGVWIAHGSGRNGKSTFFAALQKVMGNYAGTIDADVLIADGRDKKADLEPLRGKRLVVCGELEEGQRLSIAALKRIASNDTIVIKRLYHNPETITPSHHIVMHTNALPRVGTATDGATWRRLTVMPFNAVMPSGGDEVKDYASVLASKAGGAILQWLIDGARAYLDNGCQLDPPAAVAAVTDEYRQREEWLQPFIDECCVIHADARTPANTLYQAYRTYAIERGDPFVRNGAAFKAAMINLGYHNVNWRNRSMWAGITLTDDERQKLNNG